MSETGQRSLAAIVFTDAVGYTARVGADEDATIASIRQDLDLMRELCGRFEGRVLKSMGDGLMMIFASAVNAVSCALEIQKAIDERAKAQPKGRQLLHRIGIHLGDVLVTEDDAHGEGVNVAARLEEKANPGGICLSQTVYDVVKNRLFLQAAPLGDLQLKNVAEPVTAYRVAGVGGARRPQLRMPTWALAFGSIVVLAIVSVVIAIKANENAQASADPNTPTATNSQMEALDKRIGELTKIAQDIDRKNEEVKKREDALKTEKTSPKDHGVGPDDIPVPGAGTPIPPTTLGKTTTTHIAAEDLQTVLKLHKPTYDFEPIAAWLSKQEPGSEEARRYSDLANLMSWTKSQVAKASTREPVRFRIGLRRAAIVGTDTQGLVIQEGVTTLHKQMKELTPGEMVFLFQALLLNKSVPLRERARLLEAVGTFAGEYDLGDHTDMKDRDGSVD